MISKILFETYYTFLKKSIDIEIEEIRSIVSKILNT